MIDVIERLFLQQEFVGSISTSLDGFKVVKYNPYKAVFRCHICGDSSRNKRKKRGAIIQKDYGLFYVCKNCGYSHSFDTYMKDYHQGVFNQYLFELLKNKPKTGKKREIPVEEKREMPKFEPLARLPKVNHDKSALQYCRDRMLTDEMMSDMFYSDKFYAWVNSVVPDKFPEFMLKFDHPRIIIPLRDIMGSVIGFQGRAFTKDAPEDAPKYLTIMLQDLPKIWGLNRVDYNKRIKVLEGPIDAMFLDNAIALAGIDGSGLDYKNFVMVLDNQPRNPEVIGSYTKYLTQGYNIVIWPSTLKHKDINEMILAGMSVSEITQIIEKNTYSGLMAKQKFNFWRKI